MYSRILVCLDGSPASLAGGRFAVQIARAIGAELVATHIYDARLHTDRFQEMEPVLPARYQEQTVITRLRGAHDQLINEGFSALSLGYMEEFLRQARGDRVAVTQVHRQGRNYVELHRLARELEPDLLVLGAWGLGRLADRLGSTALRLLELARCDVLLARRPWEAGQRVLVGIDGSDAALEALRRAVLWARLLGGELRLAAAYDPAFHTQVFRTMGRSLSAERQAEVGLNKQEKLHDQIIDEGLGELYRVFLDQALQRCRLAGLEPAAELLQGKAYQALVAQAQSCSAGLVVVGRFGHHRTGLAPIGSNAAAVAELSGISVLVTTGGPEFEPQVAASAAEARAVAGEAGATGSAGRGMGPGSQALAWEPEALRALERVPSFARPMARAAVEEAVRRKGAGVVTAEAFREVAARFGMGRPAPGGHDAESPGSPAGG